MKNDSYNLEKYKSFAEQFHQLVKGKNVREMSLRELRKPAQASGFRTRFGSWGWRSVTSSRMAQKTVYLGSPPVQLPNADALQEGIVKSAPEELDKVVHVLKTLPIVGLTRQMGNNSEFNPICHYFASVADVKNFRLPYMWGNTLGDVSRRPGPHFYMLQVPEEHIMKQQILTMPEHNLNIALGTDYMGEIKKGFLRQAMWWADEHGMLGLHAGTKVVTAKDPVSGKLKRIGVIMFGLTATGKSTWSCHQLGMDFACGENTQVAQDDIVFLKPDGSALGSEVGFYVKTDVTKDMQEAMYFALMDETALYENVHIGADGNPDFLDEALCANGRAVIQKDRLRVQRGRRMQGIAAKSINLPSLDELDELVFAFITRRNSLMPFAQRLSARQAVLAYLWGESTHSFATRPDRAGESVRIVGTDDFIVGSRARKVNRFREILMALNDKYPGKVRFYQYNTGGMGEIIEVADQGGKKVRTLKRKVTRVPISLMSAIQRGDLRGTNEYRPCALGTEGVFGVDGEKLSQYEVDKMYSREQVQSFLADIVDGRRKFTEEIAREGLDAEIGRWADESFAIAPRPKSVSMAGPTSPRQDTAPSSWRLPARTKTPHYR